MAGGTDCKSCGRLRDRISALEDILAMPEHELRIRIDLMERKEAQAAIALRDARVRIRELEASLGSSSEPAAP